MGEEKHQIDFRGTVGLGSSPHRRGKAYLWIIHQIFIRITPAWAGKRSVELFLSVLSLDHPRVGGEKLSVCSGICAGLGSPPRGRGKAAGVLQRNRPAGITPAWAGKRGHLRGLLFSSQDHPRVGGEKAACWSVGRSATGSPPRGRGKVFSGLAAAQQLGITPAWAGKSETVGLLVLLHWDHPRVGGEKTKKIP